MKKIYIRESNRFLKLLRLYIEHKVPLKTLVELESNLELIYNDVKIEELREKVFEYHKDFFDKLLRAEKEEKYISIDVDKDKLIRYAAYLGLSQNVKYNPRGGLPPFPVQEMLHYDEDAEEKQKGDDVFEFQ